MSPADRRRVDDVALVVLAEQDRREDPHAVDDAPQVHAQRPAPVGLGALPRGAERRDAGVVADHVHRAEGVERGARRAPRPARRRDTSVRRAIHFAPAAPSSRAGRGHAGFVDVGQHDAACLRRRSAARARVRGRSPAPVTTATRPSKRFMPERTLPSARASAHGPGRSRRNVRPGSATSPACASSASAASRSAVTSWRSRKCSSSPWRSADEDSACAPAASSATLSASRVMASMITGPAVRYRPRPRKLDPPVGRGPAPCR